MGRTEISTANCCFLGGEWWGCREALKSDLSFEPVTVSFLVGEMFAWDWKYWRSDAKGGFSGVKGVGSNILMRKTTSKAYNGSLKLFALTLPVQILQG